MSEEMEAQMLAENPTLLKEFLRTHLADLEKRQVTKEDVEFLTKVLDIVITRFEGTDSDE